ncbi:MAG: hypothetical protein ABFD16_21910 [Thermoguttaceae bacterium]|jgi:hypothetical protein
MKTAGISTIAFGLMEGILALVVSTVFDLGSLILIGLGAAVCRRSRAAALWAMILSAVYVLIALITGVAAAAHGVQEVGLPQVLLATAWGAWASVNLLLLSRVRRMPETPRETPGPSEATESTPALPPLQFSLRWAFLATVLVALACWAGTKPLPPDDSWNMSWVSSSQGNTGLWVVQVVGYRSGTPVSGYLWRTEGKGEVHGPTRGSVAAGGHRAELTVGGIPVQPTKDFQLFVNDSQDRPMRLVIPRDKAREVFGRHLDRSRIEEFWAEVVAPLRSGKGREMLASPD